MVELIPLEIILFSGPRLEVSSSVDFKQLSLEIEECRGLFYLNIL